MKSEQRIDHIKMMEAALIEFVRLVAGITLLDLKSESIHAQLYIKIEQQK